MFSILNGKLIGFKKMVRYKMSVVSIQILCASFGTDDLNGFLICTYLDHYSNKRAIKISIPEHVWILGAV